MEDDEKLWYSIRLNKATREIFERHKRYYNGDN